MKKTVCYTLSEPEGFPCFKLFHNVKGRYKAERNRTIYSGIKPYLSGFYLVTFWWPLKDRIKARKPKSPRQCDL